MASNIDLTIPTAHGLGPGNGTLVRLIADFAEREPQVAGKPMPPLFEETITRVGGERPLVIGDRLDTDIEGAVTMGWDSLLVLTGVTGLEELVGAARRSGRRTSRRASRPWPSRSRRPSGPATGRRSAAGPPPWTADGSSSTGDGIGRATGGGSSPSTAWRHLDETGQPVATDGLQPPR